MFPGDRRSMAFWTACALAASSCASPDEQLTTVGLVLNVPRPGSACHPEGSSSVRLSALGDFPTTDSTVLLFDPTDLLAFDTLPLASRVLSVDAEAVVGGTPRTLSATVILGASALGPPTRDVQALLLPLGPSCRLQDARVGLLPDGALVALPDGGFLSIGGLGAGGRPVASVARLGAGLATPEVLGPDDTLFDRRAWATATLTDDAVVVVGGALADGLAALYDRIEVYDLASGRFDPNRARGLRLATARRDHGAGRLPDGRVLVVGGSGERGVMGLPVEDAELVDLEAGEVSAQVAPLPHPRRRPWVGALDDGSVLVAGGDYWQGEWKPGDTSIFAYSPIDNVFVELAGTEFERVASASVVPLPGARLAYVGVARPASAADTEPAALRVQLLLMDGTAPRVRELVLSPAVDAVRANAVSLGDGRILVTGVDVNASGTPVGVAFIVDTSLGNLVRVPAPSSEPSALLALADGTIAELDATGASLRRVSAATAFDNPGALLPMLGDPGLLALDSPGSWRVERGALVATSNGARADVALLRFAGVRIDLEARGDVDVVLTAASGVSSTVRIDDTTAGFALCGASRATESSTVHITHRGGQVSFEAGAATVTCSAPLTGRIAVALRARADTTLSALRLTRLAE